MHEAFPVIVLSIFAVAVFGVWWASAEQRIRRALQRVPRCAIRDARAGEVVKIIGKVAPAGAQLDAPLSARTCVLWDVLVEEWSTPLRGMWGTMLRETKAVDFLLEDATGRALVRAQWVRARAEKARRYDSGWMKDPTPPMEAFLAEHGKSSWGWLFKRRLRFREGVLETGDLVAVLGEARWERDPDAPGGDDAPKRLVIDAHGGAVVLSAARKATAG